MVYQCYDDILSQIGEKPIWFDEYPVPQRRAVTSENLDSCVSMVEPAEDRMRNNVSEPLD